MLKMSPARGDVATVVADMADELLNETLHAPDAARRALERIRGSLRSAEAQVWLIDGTRATRVLRATADGEETSNTAVDLELDETAISRLHANGAVFCQLGEVSDLKRLVPAAMRSSVVAASGRDATTGVLVLGWTQPVPPCGHADVAQLRIASALLVTAIKHVTGLAQTHNFDARVDAIFGSLSDRIALIDSQGRITAVNAAWTEFGRRYGGDTPHATGLGVNYFDVCRRAAASGCDEAATALEGIQDVCTGRVVSFETAYSLGPPGDERYAVMTVTPPPGPEGGAVVSHVDVTSAKVIELSRLIGQGQFDRLADSLPIAVWIAAPDGQVIHGNQRWVEATGTGAGYAATTSAWSEAFHPDDRRRARFAFRAAVARRGRFALELRMRASDGTYRWSACVGAPQFAADGRVERYVGFCSDATAKRRVESAFGEVAGKLVRAEEAERSRIGRELHDDIGQQVTLLATKLDTLSLAPRLGRRIRAGFAEARTSLQEISTSLHTLSHKLHPAKLKVLGLTRTLECLCRDVSAESRVRVTFEAREVPSDLSDDSAVCIFRVTQEALQNAVKHSGAQQVSVRLTGTGSQLTLVVSDSGRGFDPLVWQSDGIGLLTMRERVELAGGKLRIEAAQGHGTTIRVILRPGRRVA
jgi:PAS domain S-box-containing protein